MELLRAVDIPGLTSPEMTGEWEYKLKQMERGELPRDRFMAEIVGLTQKIVERAKNFEESGPDRQAARLQGARRPADGRDAALLSEQRTASSSSARSWPAACSSHTKRATCWRNGSSVRCRGSAAASEGPFAAALKLNDKNETEFVFDNAPIGADGAKLDLDTQEVDRDVSRCVSGRIFETMMSYACENTFGEAPTCKMKVGKRSSSPSSSIACRWRS